MPGKITLEALAKKVQGLKDRNDRLDKEVRALRDVLNIHDNWNAEVAKRIGKLVTVKVLTGELIAGTLKWSDRYNVCLQRDDGERIFNKGNIVWLE